ncbi:MAG: hypothetical protein WCJ42_08625, partial [Actinomycetes bacterium]
MAESATPTARPVGQMIVIMIGTLAYVFLIALGKGLLACGVTVGSLCLIAWVCFGCGRWRPSPKSEGPNTSRGYLAARRLAAQESIRNLDPPEFTRAMNRIRRFIAAMIITGTVLQLPILAFQLHAFSKWDPASLLAVVGYNLLGAG